MNHRHESHMFSFRLSVHVAVLCCLVTPILSGCTAKPNNGKAVVPNDPEVSAWYEKYYANNIKPGMTDQQVSDIRGWAPNALFLESSKLAAQEFNVRIRAVRSEADKTQLYWAALHWFSALRHQLPTVLPRQLAMRRQENPSLNIPAGTGEFLDAVGRFVSLLQEESAIRALEIQGVDQRALDWAAEYSAWIKKQGTLQQIPEFNPQSPVPGAAAESLLRMGLGDPGYLRPFDELRQAASQKKLESAQLMNLQRELSIEAADLSGKCLKTRTALSREFKLEFPEIAVE